MAILTLLDIAKRSGSDREIGLIEDVTTFAPEMGALPVRPINGVSFKSTLRTSYPTAAFRAVGGGVTPSKSEYTQKLAECFFVDCQLQIPEELPDSEDRTVGDVLTDEAVGAVRGVGITLGSQLYYGTASDANGFQGLQTFVGSGSTLTVSAAGTGATTTSVYLLYLDPKGIHFVAGRTAGARSAANVALPSNEPEIIAPPFRMPEWSKQQVQIGTAGKVAMAYVSNFSGWLGLAYGSNYSAFRVRNVVGGSTTGAFTDSLAAKLLSNVPLHIRNSGRLKWFMNPQAAFGLQASRTVTAPALQSGGATGAIMAAPIPTECQGIPIQLTNSILNTETAS